AGEVAAFPAPVGPATGETPEDLPRIDFMPVNRIARRGTRALQPGRDALFRHALQLARHTRLAEVLLRQDVHGDLRPRFRRQNVLHLEDGGAVRIDDARGARREPGPGKRIMPFARVKAWNFHGGTSCKCTNLLYWSSYGTAPQKQENLVCFLFSFADRPVS